MSTLLWLIACVICMLLGAWYGIDIASEPEMEEGESEFGDGSRD